MNSNKENNQGTQVVYTLPPKMIKVVSDKSKELAVSPPEALEVIIREWMLTVWTSGERPPEGAMLSSELRARVRRLETTVEELSEALDYVIDNHKS